MNIHALEHCESDDFVLFENDAVGVAIVRDGVVERSNTKLEQMHGCAHGGLAGRRLALFRPPVPGGAAHARGRVREIEVLRDDGAPACLRATWHDLPADRGPGMTLWIVEDLADRAKAHAAARQSRRRVAEMALHLHRAAAKLHEELSQWRRERHRDLQFEDRLRDAVERQAFELHYQPVVAMGDMSVRSVEALVRWRAEDGGWVAPSEFIPVAEANGLIAALGRWIFGEACRQAREWQQAGFAAPPIAVNLSPCQLQQPDLVDSMLDTLRTTGIDPACIELEITETSLMQDIDVVLPRLQRLAASGVQLALDDFGTGYSSLAYLRRLPVSKLKIDQSFVRDLRAECSDTIIVSAVIGLARNLGLTTVAEGVETAEQVEVLRGLGCDHVQGYYFSRPCPAAAAQRLLARRGDTHESLGPVGPGIGPMARRARPCMPLALR